MMSVKELIQNWMFSRGYRTNCAYSIEAMLEEIERQSIDAAKLCLRANPEHLANTVANNDQQIRQVSMG
jgi:hypothetical protein